MVLRTIWRLIVVPIGFLLAALASVFVLFTLGLEKITHAMHGREAGAETIQSMFDLAWEGSLLASGMSIIPALAVVLIGEVARIRSWLYYMIGGGLALAAMPLLARIDPSAPYVLPQSAVWQIFATAGFVGGLVYWLIAGRKA